MSVPIILFDPLHVSPAIGVSYDCTFQEIRDFIMGHGGKLIPNSASTISFAVKDLISMREHARTTRENFSSYHP